jgi:hypothetical protein
MIHNVNPFMVDNGNGLSIFINVMIELVKNIIFNILWPVTQQMPRDLIVQKYRGYTDERKVYFKTRIPLSLARLPLLLKTIEDTILKDYKKLLILIYPLRI